MYDPNLLTDTERGPPQRLPTLQEKIREIQTTSNPASTFQYTAAELFYLHETPPSTRFQPTPGTARQIPHVSKIFVSSHVPLPATYRLPRRHHYQLPQIDTNTTPYISYSRNKKEAITHQRKDSGYESCAYMFMGITDQNEADEDEDVNDIEAWCNAVLAQAPLPAPIHSKHILRPDAPEFYPLINNPTQTRYDDPSANDFGEGRRDYDRDGDEDRHTILAHAPLPTKTHHTGPLWPDAPIFYTLIRQSYTRSYDEVTPLAFRNADEGPLTPNPPSTSTPDPSRETDTPSTTTETKECGNQFAVTAFEMAEMDYEGLSSRLGFGVERDTSSEGLCEGYDEDERGEEEVWGYERSWRGKGCRMSI